MKKKNILYALIGVLFLTLFFGITKVNAEEYVNQAIWNGEFIDNVYIKKFRSDGTIKSEQGRFMRRSEDNKFVYCLQPYVGIDNNLPWYQIARSDFETVLNMTKEQWNRISLLAYYGYYYVENGYDHSDAKWYVVTQVLIWRTAALDSKIVFTDTMNGNILPNKFASEIAEMESLIANHKMKPDFNENEMTIPLGKSVELNDTNGVLNKFTISSVENGTASINGNTLTITPTSIGKVKVNFVKQPTAWNSTPIVYFSDHSQNVLRTGNFDPVKVSVELEVVGGRVEIYKVDSDTKMSIPQGTASLENAKYGIYNLSDEKVGEIVTDEYGYGISDYLPSLGQFYLKEISSSKGYLLDANKYTFNITKDNLLEKVEVYEKVIESDIILFKTFANGSTGILKGEPNIDFAIFLNNCTSKLAPHLISNDEDNEQQKDRTCYIDTITTDDKGYAEITLPYGKYTFKQVNSTSNYEKVDDFNVIIDEESESNIYKLISNAPITAKLKVIKTDKETGKVITKSGIKFRIKDATTNEYVCQTITYPTAKKVCVYETDKNGIIITPDTLVGDFYLEEVEDQILEGYVWNKEQVLVHIGDGSEIVIDKDYGSLLVVKFANERVKGKINITKYGEELMLADKTYKYEKILLSDVKLGLYADEDIYIGNTKKYLKDELIQEVITKDGKVSIDNLELGKYYLKELSTNDNHSLDETLYSFEITYKDQYTNIVVKDIELQNYYKKGTLEFTKTDIATGKVIPNTLIEIYSDKELEDGTIESTLIYSGLTDEEGKIVLKDLFIGKGHIIEKESATGYQITDEIVYFEITEDGQVFKANMTNEQIVEVPNTMATRSKLYSIISGSLIVVGMGVYLYATKKNKKK